MAFFKDKELCTKSNSLQQPISINLHYYTKKIGLLAIGYCTDYSLQELIN